jgi:cell division septation protein DedD
MPMTLRKGFVLRLAPVIVLALPLWSGCAGSPAASDKPAVAALIVKPRAQARDADALMQLVVRHLPRPAMARYARAMSGGAHLVYLTAPATREDVPLLVERLRASGDFEYVDLDMPVRIK